jgi:hypothetical protein
MGNAPTAQQSTPEAQTVEAPVPVRQPEELCEWPG